MRRLVTLGVALVLAVVGTILLLAYVRGAEQRALEGQQLASVYVVASPIPAGADLDTVRQRVQLTEIPVHAVARGAVSDLDALADLVPAVNLIVGEQILAGRFVAPAELEVDTRVEVPPEFLQLTIHLTPERTIGGQIVPGDLVAFLVSFQPFNLGGIEPGIEPDPDVPVVPVDPTDEDEAPELVFRTPHSTHVMLNKMLVTGVQYQSEEAPGTDRVTPAGALLVTLAATAEEAEQIVFAMEYGSVWLARQHPDAPEPETVIRTRANIFR